GLAEGLSAFCARVAPTLDRLDFSQRRQLIELLIDRVIVADGAVEIRYVVPTSPKGEGVPFCHLRKDYFDLRSGFLVRKRSRKIAHIGDQIEWLLIGLLPDRQQADRTVLLCGHPGRTDRQQLSRPQAHIADVELDLAGRNQDVRGGATDVVPASPLDISLQVD